MLNFGWKENSRKGSFDTGDVGIKWLEEAQGGDICPSLVLDHIKLDVIHSLKVGFTSV